MPWEVGEVLIVEANGELYSKETGYVRTPAIVTATQADRFNKIFRKMGWFEGRELKDLPEYVIVQEPNSLWEDTPAGCVRTAAWKFNDNNHLVCDIFPVMVNNMQLYRLLPATHEQYRAYSKR